MDKLIKMLNLEVLKGSRTKLSLLVTGVLGVLAQFGILSHDQVETIVKLALPFGLYFAVEHWEPKKV